MADEKDNELETTGTPGDAVPARLLKEVEAERDSQESGEQGAEGDHDAEGDEDEEEEVGSSGDTDDEE